MRHFAIVGSGPAGFYTAEALAKAYGEEARIDIIDKLPVPYGLIRFGVAPDHQSIKAVSRRYEKVAEEPTVRFIGNVGVGTEIAIEDLRRCYDGIVLATGAPNDRSLGIEGADLAGVVGSAAFVGWYNGHPDFADLDPPLDGAEAAIIGAGNVALDVARILSKTTAELEGSDISSHALEALERSAVTTITIVVRRGPHQIAMTPKELGELAHLEEAAPNVDPADLPPVADDETLDPGQRKSVTLLRQFADTPPDGSKPKTIIYDFFARPVRIEGDRRAERLIVERTSVDAAGNSIGTGEIYAIPASLLVSCIGYQTPPIPAVPYDEKHGRFLNDHGQIDEQLYCVGWARRGPTGTIGTNRPDGFEVADQLAAAMPPQSDGGKRGGAMLDELLAARGVQATSFDDWRIIEAAETAAARPGSPREKIVRHSEWLELLGR
ncbi:FAD-dependent oxidoreductase [Sphingomonas xanthus]|uniref:Pyridine nucleotide-disulfide oxidoreductase n=1 Tax=Sphingomonas xanthus TaxID=2594473 RepID=A0A516IS62_9SPHN|nr:FAD-dependent oxidoreductase [Sphingomonas xanthus]QDP19752.1 pyridine nucleotide-disulfide oxidoreductase [Sphingomonas xanthus]